MSISACLEIQNHLLPNLETLKKGFQKKEKEFASIVDMAAIRDARVKCGVDPLGGASTRA